MNYYTLREVCEIASVSRRAIQGYEKIGLVKPAAKNERGYLLYDSKGVDRIKTIRLFQQFGFALKEIVVIIDVDQAEQKRYLEKQLSLLEEDAAAKREIICKIKGVIQQLSIQTEGEMSV